MSLSIRILALGFLSSLLGVATFGQNPPGPGTNQNQDHSAKKITGCLPTGDKSGIYWISETNGNVWNVKSSKLDLSQHVGHRVTIMGYWADYQTTETPKNPNAAQKEKDNSPSAADSKNTLEVKRVKEISASCPAK
jgi:hypothetical protein